MKGVDYTSVSIDGDRAGIVENAGRKRRDDIRKQAEPPAAPGGLMRPEVAEGVGRHLADGHHFRRAPDISFARKIIREVCLIAEKKGIKNPENLEQDALNALAGMCDEGRTSMHQDILAGRKTEVELFAGEILRLGKELDVETPFNQVLYDMIKILEERNEHCIHSGKGRE